MLSTRGWPFHVCSSFVRSETSHDTPLNVNLNDSIIPSLPTLIMNDVSGDLEKTVRPAQSTSHLQVS